MSSLFWRTIEALPLLVFVSGRLSRMLIHLAMKNIGMCEQISEPCKTFLLTRTNWITLFSVL